MTALRWFLLLVAAPSMAQTVEVVPVVVRTTSQVVKLPGEFQPYMAVPVFARVTGFVSRIDVDRGSRVEKGQVLAVLDAPEMAAQLAEAQSKAQSVSLQKAEAQARLAAAESTYERLKAASSTRGAVAGNDLTVAEKNVEAVRALVQSYSGSQQAAAAAVQAIRDLSAYLTIQAPFDGIVVERNVHPGALVGPGAGANQPPLMRVEQVARLRLVVAVPEAHVGGIVPGARVPFSVPAYPGEMFHGVLKRLSRSLDQKTRSMPVELDVDNADLRLAPGMYPELAWPVRHARPSVLVPATSIVTTTERVFVIRARNGKAEWVNVVRGNASGDLVEVLGPLSDGDLVVRRGSDELRPGTTIVARQVTPVP